MDKFYQILLVEDEAQDAELNIREIKKVLPNSKFEITDNRNRYMDLLLSYRPDIILSDFNMPSFDGLSALKIAQEMCPHTPFIMVTGSINEDTAVECMKAGASDYVLKDSLKRLGSAIINALKQRDLGIEKFESEKRLIESEKSYYGLFNSVSEAIYIINARGEFIAINAGTEKMYGYSSEEVIGKTSEFLAANGLNDLKTISQQLKDVLATGIQQQFEFWGKRKNGDIFPNEVICNKGNYFGQEVVIATGRDITDRKEAEEKLKRERKLLRTLIDNLPVTIYVKDRECRKVIANRADLKIVGLKTEVEVLGKTDLETYGPEVGMRGFTDDKKVIDSGEAVLNREEDFWDENGIQRWLITSKIPLTEENGEIIGLVGIGRDITEQKLAQEKILKLSMGIEQSSATIVITDINGSIEYVNPAFTATSGWSEEEAISLNHQILKSGNMESAVYIDLWETISSGNVWRGELQNRKKDGSLYWEWATITSIKNDKGIITNYIAIKEDITERKKMQAELIQAKEKAEESDRLKSAFLANMSHEIRTPLNSIIGFSELLGDPSFDEQQKDEFRQTIVDNGNNLLFIISDIMDFSMLEAGQMKIRKELISVRKLLTELQNDFSKKAIQKGIEFRIALSQNTPDVQIESDLYRIRQIFNNLIGNALKFTLKGYIEIGYQVENNIVTFHTKDTGIGIDSAYHQSIFERFRQVDLAKTRKYGGNGLGLAISKNLVELLGGTIWVESEPDKFSNFIFTIPIKTEDL
ncbi:diguanylate cyclase/phosphodiesterase with PAS/PAC sensor(s) [Aquipluma nitroreducens]|uniref:histidine kinase n=1 Tax=Aquipluma nitroreducens TaxID=2010828 RepID=A0A5K7S2V0_9BACT|nr:PAS domain S-box protein [Aquipluma nitroreducens]BBE15931.1 diguanylate cyclase/phosphodiesterase with PAS/PAC sensor(s) [Aquipluma nitroreducens]